LKGWPLAVFLGGLGAVSAAFAVAHLASDVATQRFFDNVHWTVGYGAGAVLAWLGVRNATAGERRPRIWFAWALTAYFFGQVLWDIQVAIGWNPFPGPSDLLFIALGPLVGAGFVDCLRGGASRAERRLAALDVAGFTAAGLALTLAMYLPRRGDHALLQMSFLVGYPVVLCWTACTGIVSVLTLRLTPHRGWSLMLLAMVMNGALWLEWNARTLDNTLADGVWYNVVFSVTALVLGAGAMQFRAERSHDEDWERFCEGVLRLSPLLIVMVSAAAVVLALTLSRVPTSVQWSAVFGALVVTILAVVRQGVMLREREQLMRAERELHSAVEERAALEAQLRQAQKMEAIGTLAAGIAHDFNNILSAIRGNADLAELDLGANHPVLEHITQIQAASVRATQLVQRIVAFSKPREPVMERVDLAAAITEVLRLLRSALPAGVEIRTQLQRAPKVAADPAQIHQLLMNLCTNAWQALEGKPGQIAIELTEEEITAGARMNLPPGDYALIKVSDTGKGMDERIRERIFEPFFTTKAPGEGTGLGLSIVHSIVRGHQGAIVVDSSLGQGTTFSVYLPRSSAAISERQPPAQPLKASTHVKAQIAYVDDEPMLVSLMERQLQMFGFDVTGFGSSEEALAAVREAPDRFAMLVTDYNMPRMSGLDLARAVARIRPKMKFVITSGYIDDVMRTDAKALGIEHLLQKPAPLEQIVRVIEEAWQQSLST
jgi:signal transduction histidine kinase/ActR/RegA family two-component response regulator